MNITLDTTNSAIGAASEMKLAGVKSAKETTETTETAAADSSSTQQVQTRKYDTVELSDDAQQYLTEESDTEEQTEEAKLLSESVDTSSDDDDEVSTTELYSYTDDQLSEMLANGEITQLQYNTVMAKRTEE